MGISNWPAFRQRFDLRDTADNNSAKTHRHIYEYTRRIAIELRVVGLMNIQYAICNDKVYILEANPRASRTVPLVSKVCGLSMARIATQLMLGKKLSDLNLKSPQIPHYGVKESVFPFYFFPEVDPVLGPEMRSTGEVLGMADSFGLAFFKAEDAAQGRLPVKGTVLMTIADKDKGPAIVDVARNFINMGFKIKATEGTQVFLAKHGITAERAYKRREQRPDIADDITNGEIQLLINTPMGKASKEDDSYIRKAAIRYKTPSLRRSRQQLQPPKASPPSADRIRRHPFRSTTPQSGSRTLQWQNSRHTKETPVART